MHDRDLLTRVSRSDLAALAELFENWQERMVGIAFYILRDQHAAEDAIHDLFHRWTVKAPQTGGYTNVRGFVGRAASNAAVDWIRKDRSQRGEPPRTEAEAPTAIDRRRRAQLSAPEEGEERSDLEAILALATDELNEEEQLLVLMSEAQMFTREEVARLLNCSVDAVDYRAKKAREHLAQALARVREQRRSEGRAP